MSSGLIFVGLDIETTGTDPGKHQLIEIGVCDLLDTVAYGSDVGWAHGDYDYEVEALNVNKFDVQRIEAGPSWLAVCEPLDFFLRSLGARRHNLVPVGWNVGSFDMPFVRNTFPGQAFYFTHRAVDLNSVVYSIAVADGEDPKIIKDGAKAYARGKLEGQGTAHEALYDARSAVHEWAYLRGLV